MMKELLFSRSLLVLLVTSLIVWSGCSVSDSTGEIIEPEEMDLSEVTFNARSSNFNFTASLKGRYEVPPVTTNATGNAIVKISKDESSIYYKLTVGNIDDVRASHFHMASPGSNGPVVATLFSGVPNGRVNGVLAEGTITSADVSGPLAGDLAALIDRIRTGRIYVNVHTNEVRSGELRGNL